MPQFFIKASDIKNNMYIISGEDFRHLRKVRRVKEGEFIDLRGDDGSVYKGMVAKINPESISVEIIRPPEKSRCESPVNLSIYPAVLKGKAFDIALQKATEVGVNRIVPVITERTIPVIGGKDKRARWEKIVEEAAKQCMRNDIPAVTDAVPFNEAVMSSSSGIRLIAHPEGVVNIRDYLSGIHASNNSIADISILIGPEGGFAAHEIEFASKYRWEQVRFGFTSLRAETASIVLPAVIIYEWSNSGEFNC